MQNFIAPLVWEAIAKSLADRNRTSDRWITLEQLQSTALPTELQRVIAMIDADEKGLQEAKDKRSRRQESNQ